MLGTMFLSKFTTSSCDYTLFVSLTVYMAKKKLQRFAEIETFPNVFYLPFGEKNFSLYGKWHEHFGNKNPIVLELGCGKGEYTIGLAEKHPNKNFIGVDIKGNRIWRGAKTAVENKMKNAAFLRTRIELIENAFAKNEVSEIWITFPDPQPKKENKRLTSIVFLERYKKIIQQKGIIHLKTDNQELFDFTLKVISESKLKVLDSTDDLYSENDRDKVKLIKTYYEQKFLKQGNKITYIKFQI